MSTLKSVIITLPKGLSKAIPANEFACSTAPRLNFVTSLLTDKAKMDARKITVRQQEEMHDDSVTTLIKPADGCVRGKKRRLDHLTWEEKLQRKWVKERFSSMPHSFSWIICYNTPNLFNSFVCRLHQSKMLMRIINSFFQFSEMYWDFVCDKQNIELSNW